MSSSLSMSSSSPESVPDATLSSTDSMPPQADYYDTVLDEADYGYEDAFAWRGSAAAPTSTSSTTFASSLATAKATRRSSLKSAMSAKHRLRRRASLSYKGEIEIQLVDKSTVRRSVSIGFAEERNRVHVLDPHEYNGTTDDLWLKPQEEAMMRDKASFVVEYARRVGPDEMDRKQIDTRGLEPYIYKEESEEKRKLAAAAVLGEQYEQRCRGVYIDKSIGEAYAKLSSFCQEMAQVQADIDYCEVKPEHRQTRRLLMRRSSC